MCSCSPDWFLTVKGALVRYILFPKESKFSFYSDSYKFIAVMFSFSFIGMAVQLIQSHDIEWDVFIKKCLI